MDTTQHQYNYIISLFFLSIGLGLLIFSLYIFPHLILHWHYKLPGFILEWKHFLMNYYKISATTSGSVLFIIFLSLAIICMLITNKLSNMSNNIITEVDIQKPVIRTRASLLSLQILLMIILIFMLGKMFQWLIS